MKFTRPKMSQPEIDPAWRGPADSTAVEPTASPIPEPGLDRSGFVLIADEPGQESKGITRYLLYLYGGLIGAFLVFYALADYTAYTVAEQRPGQLIISNTMTQLWTACFRLAFILGVVSGAILAIQRLFWPDTNGHSVMTAIKHELTFFQRLCVLLLAFFGLCFLFIQLLSVNLPQTVSVGR